MGTINASSLKLLHFSVSPRFDTIDRVKVSTKLTAFERSFGIAIKHSDHFLVTIYRGNRKPVAEDDSDMEHEENLMTDQQKEEEAMFKYTFNSFLTGKQGVPIERYELPMILDGKSTSKKLITSAETPLFCFH